MIIILTNCQFEMIALERCNYHMQENECKICESYSSTEIGGMSCTSREMIIPLTKLPSVKKLTENDGNLFFEDQRLNN